MRIKTTPYAVKIMAVVAVLMLSAHPGLAQDTLSVHATRLMKHLNEQVVKYLNRDRQSPDHGAVWCPGCQLYHTRAAEALYPLAYEYTLTGDKERLRQAIALGDWLIRQQEENGSWKETPEEWTGTTTDQLLMMVLAWPTLEPHLKKEEKEQWLRSMERAGDYLAEVMNNRFASINYCATTTATLAELNRVIPKQSYAEKARELARMIVAKMNPEYFIEGEGSRVGAYKYGVDIGYNVEMSLWGLARYAEVTGDKPVTEAVARSLENHIWFLYPDGTLDVSAGIRSNKWTVFGSGTSDGCHPLLALMSDRDEAYIAASVRNIGQIERSLTAGGLLGMGPHYDRIFTDPPCIYPTFTKAKSMAMAMQWSKKDIFSSGAIPTDRPGFRHFPSLNIAVVRTEKFCATVTGYNYKAGEGAKSKYMHRPAGGVVSALWLEDFGLLQASSQTEYHRWEPMSFPVLPDVKPLTPRIEVQTEEGYYTNLYDFDTAFSANEAPGGAETAAYGQLRNRDWIPCGISYTLTHRFGNDSMTKEFRIGHQTLDAPVRIVEPFLLNEGIEITRVDERNIRIRNGEHSLLLTLEADRAVMRLGSADDGNYSNIYPSLRAMPVMIDVPPDPFTRRSSVKLTYQVEN